MHAQAKDAQIHQETISAHGQRQGAASSVGDEPLGGADESKAEAKSARYEHDRKILTRRDPAVAGQVQLLIKGRSRGTFAGCQRSFSTREGLVGEAEKRVLFDENDQRGRTQQGEAALV